MEKFRELLFLKQIKGIGNARINNKYISFLEKTSSFDECVRFVKNNEEKITDLDIEFAIRSTQKKCEYIDSLKDVHVITRFDSLYPKGFDDLGAKKPVILYAKGNVNALQEKNIAIVGTRTPSEWSSKVEELMVKKILELSNRVIVSGLALGCDRIAHEVAVKENAKTVAVLPSGVNVITPAAHKQLAKDILENNGCLISEYEPDAKVTKSTYVERDALVAALSEAVVVIECGEKSGTMHTVSYAERMKRRLACYYSLIQNRGNYSGNELMLKTKGAKKITDTNDLILFLSKIDSKDTKEYYEQFQLDI